MFVLKFTDWNQYVKEVSSQGFHYTSNHQEAKKYESFKDAFADLNKRGAEYSNNSPIWGWPVPMRVQTEYSEEEIEP